MRKVYSLIFQLYDVSGVQRILLDIHNGIKKDFDAKVAGFYPYEEIVKKMDVSQSEYVQLKSIRDLRDALVITHERKSSTKCYLMNILFRLNMKLIHVQHSVYHDLRYLSFYPSNIVSISDAITANLASYFRISPERITKIHNGLIDECSLEPFVQSDGKIRVAYVARIDLNKRQLDIVDNLKDKLPDNIEISFVGNGPLLSELVAKTKGMTSFKVFGFRKDVIDIIQRSDYVMLFSGQEGLPVTLIEGVMCKKPLIINDVGGNIEIGKPHVNAFLANGWDELIEVLTLLKDISKEEYKKMSENSRKIYEQNFTYDIMIQKYKDLINRVS